MASTSQATQNNNKLFPLYSKKLASDDPATYATFADKLSVWLSSERAYYSNARPEIVKLLLTAQATLRRAVGADANTPFHISSFHNHPMTAPYARLVGIIQPYYNLFKEKELRARVKLLLYSISAPRLQSASVPLVSSISPAPTSSKFISGAGDASEHLPVAHVTHDPSLAMQSSSSSLASALQVDPPRPPTNNASAPSSQSTPLPGNDRSHAMLPTQAAEPVAVSHPLPQILLTIPPQDQPSSALSITPVTPPSQLSGNPCTLVSVCSTSNDTQTQLPSATLTANAPAVAKPKAKKKIKADLTHLLELDVKGYLQKKGNTQTQPPSSTTGPSSAIPTQEERSPIDHISPRRNREEEGSSQQPSQEPKQVPAIEPISASTPKTPSIPPKEFLSTAEEPGKLVDSAESPPKHVTVLSRSDEIKQEPQQPNDSETMLGFPPTQAPSPSGGGEAMDIDCIAVPVDRGTEVGTLEPEDAPFPQPSIEYFLETVSAANPTASGEDVVMDEIPNQQDSTIHKEIGVTQANDEEGDPSPAAVGPDESLSSAFVIEDPDMEHLSVYPSSPRLATCHVSMTPTSSSEFPVDTAQVEIQDDGTSTDAVPDVPSGHEFALDIGDGNLATDAAKSEHLSTGVHVAGTADSKRIADGEDVTQYNSLIQSMQDISLPLTQPEVAATDHPRIDTTTTATTAKSTESLTLLPNDGQFLSRHSSSLTSEAIDVSRTPDLTAVASVNSRKRVRTPSTSEAGPASVVRPRISRSPQLLLLGTTGSPTHNDGGTVLNTQPFPASSVVIEHLTPPEQARLWKSKPLVDSLRTKSDLTVGTDQATLSLSGSSITGSNITPLMTNENASNIEDGEVLLPVSTVFGPEMRVIAIQQGSASEGTITIEFSMNQNQLDMISKWSNWTRSTENVKESLCLSLACYLSAELLVLIRKSARTSIEQLICEHRSLWPKDGGLSMKVNFNGSLETFPLSPPFAVTPNNLVDVSQFMTLGKNIIELNQRRDMSKYTFFLHAHYPTSAQLQQVARRRKKDQNWRDWLRQASQPLDVPLGQLH